MTVRRKGKNAVLSKRNVPNHDIYAKLEFFYSFRDASFTYFAVWVDGSEGWWGSRSKERQYFTKMYSFVWNMRSLTQGNNELTFITTVFF